VDAEETTVVTQEQWDEVETLRREAAEDPEGALDDLAMALVVLADRLLWLERWEESVAVGQESVAVLRRLAEGQPDYLAHLATSLSNLSAALEEVDRPDEALGHRYETAAVRRRLAQQDPEENLPHLVWALHNLAVALGERERPADALAVAEEAVGVSRELDRRHPGAFVRELAGSLDDLAYPQGELGRGDEALATTAEAIALYRRDVEQYRADLAQALSNFGAYAAESGSPHDALAAIEEATGHYRVLAHTEPDPHLENLALALEELAECLGRVGRGREQRRVSKEAAAVGDRLGREE